MIETEWTSSFKLWFLSHIFPSRTHDSRGATIDKASQTVWTTQQVLFICRIAQRNAKLTLCKSGSQTELYTIYTVFLSIQTQ